MSAVAVGLWLLGLYVAAGLVLAVAFVAGTGVDRVTGQPATLGAKLLFIPGVTILWPLVLRRWLRAPA